MNFINDSSDGTWAVAFMVKVRDMPSSMAVSDFFMSFMGLSLAKKSYFK
ncbi:hypothetical protein [Moraxella lacunata]